MGIKFAYNNGQFYDKWSNKILNEQFIDTNDDYYLTEEDLYSVSDDRIWTSNIEDIEDGDNFADYCRDFFNLLEEEEYFD